MDNAQHYSAKRNAILATIAATDTHPSAEWVYTELRERYPSISLGTVYRNIAQLKEAGDIIAVANVDGHERLDGKVSPHTHFICEKCGAIIDLKNIPSDYGFYRSIAEKYGCEVTSHSLVFYGTCAKCLQKH